MITYRNFCNWDPPALVELWNSSLSGRGVARDIGVQDLDRLVFSKPYFDPKGLILAQDGDELIGFAHAGFGASGHGMTVSREYGVIAMLMVAPGYRRQGIGRGLVGRAERYLRGMGSSVIYAGSIHPLDPFYIGLYGGSELPGILRSNQVAHHLFRALGYRAVDECVVYQKKLERPIGMTYVRARTWARHVEFHVELQAVQDCWWSACRYSCLDNISFEARLRSTGESVAKAVGWEMYPLEKSWGVDAVGIVDVEVIPQYRNRGIGLFLMTHVLRHYRGYGLPLAEVQTMDRNTAARKLYLRLGFQEVDRGVVYRAEN